MVENTRRDFIKRTAWGTAAMLAYPSSARVLGANDRIRVGMIGVGGRGSRVSGGRLCGARAAERRAAS